MKIKQKTFDFKLNLSEFPFLLSSTLYIRRKYWNPENFRLPVFIGFTRFGIFLIRFHYFTENNFFYIYTLEKVLELGKISTFEYNSLL